MKLLHVDSSITGPGSISRELTAKIVASKAKRHAGLEIVYRDLAAAPIDHLSGAYLGAVAGASPETPALQRDLGTSVAALEEFLAADIIVIGAPMYNFGVPSQLKAWIDRLAVAGKTFQYTETGPKGLVTGKEVIIASSRGNLYGAETPLASLDHQENYLRSVLAFFGITNPTIIRAEGIAFGDDARAAAVSGALNEAEKLAA